MKSSIADNTTHNQPLANVREAMIPAPAQQHIDLATFHLYESLPSLKPTFDSLDADARNAMRRRVFDARELMRDLFVDSIARRSSADPAEDVIFRALAGSGVPSCLHDGLRRYFIHHIRPGSFLTAVLSMDMVVAVRRADPTCFAAMSWIVLWLASHAPARSWGCPVTVDAWVAERQKGASRDDQ